MNVGQIVNNNYNAQANNQAKTAAEKTQDKKTTMAADNIDKFDSDSVNVNRNHNSRLERTDELNIQRYRGRSALQIKNEMFADFVKYNVGQQSGNDFWKSILGETFTPRSFAADAFKAAEATSEKHKDYWGVEATAERIFTFAKSLAGDRDELFETMKNAFLKGFNQASKASGNRLPDISQQTKARVLEMFDEWEAEIKGRK